MVRRLDWRSVRLHRGYEAFDTSGSNSVQQTLTTAQRDALPADELRAGDRIWNTTTQTLQAWTGVLWVDIGGGTGTGGHLGVGGETTVAPLDFQDHDTYNASWMWRWQARTLFQMPTEGPDWFCNDNGGGWVPFGACFSDSYTGSVFPSYGIDPESDAGLTRNALVIPPDGIHGWCPQYFVVKGLTFTSDDSDPGTWTLKFNAVLGFASNPWQGLRDSTDTTWNMGAFFIAADGLDPMGTGPLDNYWYACVASNVSRYAVPCLNVILDPILVLPGVKHKFFVEWHGDDAVHGEGYVAFYIDDVLAATITHTAAGTSWPNQVGYPTLGVSNMDDSDSVYPQVFLPFIHATSYTPDNPGPS